MYFLKNNKRGFTLIELLAVIVIIAVIFSIATPIILNSIESSRRESFKRSVEGSMNSIEYYLFNNKDTLLKNGGVPLSDLPLKNKSQFTGGKIILNSDGEYEAVKVTNGKYCVSGLLTELVLFEDCGYDFSTPDVVFSIVSKTSNTINVSATASDTDSGISKYEFAIDTGAYVDNGTTSTYTYSNVTAGTHTLKVRVTNGSGLTTETSITTSPTDITVPTYVVSPSGYATSKTVTVTYPTREAGFIYTYSIDSGTTWTTVNSGVTASVVFNSNGSIIARIYDGTNYKTASSFTVAGIDTTSPTVSLGVISKTSNTINVSATAADTDSGISKYEFAIDTGAYVDNGTTSTYTYSNVTAGTHTLKVRVTNGSGLTTETSITTSPTDITVPTYVVSPSGYATSKTVTVTYPTREAGFIYTYSIDSGTTWTTVNSGVTASVVFNSNGSIIARIYDGTNYVTASTFEVTGIEANPPVITSFNPIEKLYQKITVQAITDGTGNPIAKYEFAVDTGSYVDNGTSNTYTYTGLSGSAHTLKVRVTNEAGLQTEQELTNQKSHITVVMTAPAQTNTTFSSNTLSYYGDTGTRVIYSSGTINLSLYSSVNVHVYAYVSSANQGTIGVKMGLATTTENSYDLGWSGTNYSNFTSSNVIGGTYTDRYYTWEGTSTSSRYIKIVTNRSQSSYNGNIQIVKVYVIPKI